MNGPFLPLLLPLLAGGEAPPVGPQGPADVRANEFTKSAQEAVVLAGDRAGAVVAWQSRRQQAGTYGIYARRYDARGAALSGEVQVNAATEGMQMQPTVALAADGTAWFAWRSFGADGDQGAILARRFDGALGTATPEVLVHQERAGHQTDPVVAALPDGGALVVYLGPAEAGGPSQVRARRLAADGTALGDSFRLDQGEGAEHRTPTLATTPDGHMLVAYARADERGVPAGLFVRRLGADGRPLGDELRLDPPAARFQGIEPTVALAAGGRALAGWLQPGGDDHTVRVRSLDWNADDLALGAVHDVPVTGGGYTSGLDVVLSPAGDALAVWNRHGDGERGDAGLFACKLDATGAPVGEPFRATHATEGSQALAVAVGTHRALLLDDGTQAFAWTGDAGLGDDSGAHLSLWSNAYAPVIARAGDGPHFAPAQEGARPHDPPVFDPKQIEDQRLQEIGSPLSAANFDFLAFNNTGWTPPDCEMAVGPDHIVAMVNGGIAWYLKDGTQQFFQDINGQSGFWGVVNPSNGFVFDPEVVFDTHGQRFVAFASDSNAGFLLAVSDDADPNGTWFKYKILTNPIFGTAFVDSGNLAVDEDVITITGDIFSPDRLVMLFIDKTTAYSGSSLVFQSSVISGRQSMGTAVNYDTGNQPQYLVWAREFQTSTTLTIYGVSNQLSSPTTQNVDLTVPSYSHPNDPPQMGTTVRPELFEARFWSAMVRDGYMWCTHHQGSDRSRVRWYQIDLNGWPGSGNPPSLVQSGDIDLGAGIFAFFGSIWADANQNAAVTFARSSSNEFISMQMTYRLAGDAPGTMRAPIEVLTSASPDTSGRWGDYSATNDDPALPNSFWGHHEYRTANAWRTRIGRIDLPGTCGTTYCGSSQNPANVATIAIDTCDSASSSITLSMANAPANQFAYLLVGDGNATISQPPGAQGDLCVAGGSCLGRYDKDTGQTSGAGTFSTDVLNAVSNPCGGGVTVVPGATWNFQFWHRNPMGALSSFSEAIAVTFQ